LLGVIMTKSIAAVLLSVLAVVGSAAIVLSGFPRRVRLGFVGGVVLVVIVVAWVAMTNGTSDLGSTALSNSALGRREIWHATRAAIGQFGLLGSGFGSFPPLFHLFENPDAVDAVVINHAHNDLLEFVLEGGIPAVLLLLAFLAWFGVRLVSVWLREKRRDPLAQGASITVLIVLLHSLVDYPLRTAAVATLFGFCLALLARGETGSDAQEDTQPASQQGRHLSA
jgi:O-antigen ligase